MGPGLRTSGYADQYLVPDAAFIKRAVASGDRGYEVAKAHLAAAGNDPRAIAAMQDGALAPLRADTAGAFGQGQVDQGDRPRPEDIA